MKLNKLVSTLHMDHEVWLENRRKGIGGSDAGSICGLNPYSSAIAVFQDKTQPLTEKPDNESMRQGRDLEEYVARRFMEETGKKVRRANAIFYKEEQPFMLANVDRLIVGENAGLECKTASAYSADKWKDGHIPESYEIQCHHYMAVTGADAWYIAYGYQCNDAVCNLWTGTDRSACVPGVDHCAGDQGDAWSQQDSNKYRGTGHIADPVPGSFDHLMYIL